MKRERFKYWFHEYPENFKGLMTDPYYYQTYQQEGNELLERFGFCSMCEGSGTSYAECCWGHGCPCNGQPVRYTCQVCNGTGVSNFENIDANNKYITRLAESNKGYLYTQSDLPF